MNITNKVASVILLNEKKEILLYLRDDKKTIPSPNCWSTLGGHVENNESVEEALKREIKEEIDYDIGDISFLGSFGDLVGNKVYMYKSVINKKIEELHLSEGQRLDFFSFEEAMKIKIPQPLKMFLLKNKNKILNP